MDGRHFVIYEPTLSELGTFDSLDAALAYVETLRAVNTEDFLDELTVSKDTEPVLYEEVLRRELDRRASERAQTVSRSRRCSEGLGASGSSYTPIAARGFD